METDIMYKHKTRIDLDMSVTDAVQAIARDGSRRSLEIAIDTTRPVSTSIDSRHFGGAFAVLLDLDTLGIYDDKLVTLFDKVCDGCHVNLRTRPRARQLGMISDMEVMDPGLPVEQYLALVRRRLPEFAKGRSLGDAKQSALAAVATQKPDNVPASSRLPVQGARQSGGVTVSASLIQLPNGAWIRPDTILSVIPRHNPVGMLGKASPCVVVTYGLAHAVPDQKLAYLTETVNCETLESAKALANDITLRIHRREGREDRDDAAIRTSVAKHALTLLGNNNVHYYKLAKDAGVPDVALDAMRETAYWIEKSFLEWVSNGAGPVESVTGEEDGE